MSNPYAIQVHCDGAMSYDKYQTGGNGFYIEFPESIDKETISRSIRNDQQGIHRLEMISILEAIEELLLIDRKEPGILRKAGSVEIFTDRHSVTDETNLNPYKVQVWRKNKWKSHEGADIKNSKLIDGLDKARMKLAKAVGGRVSIFYKKEKSNKVADKLSKIGKTVSNRGRKMVEKKRRNVIKRLFDGPEIKYSDISLKTAITARVYAWELINKDVEICFEIISRKHRGMIIKARVGQDQKSKLHRGHIYHIKISEILRHHITIKSFKEKTIPTHLSKKTSSKTSKEAL
jgi:ribonuclease HI